MVEPNDGLYRGFVAEGWKSQGGMERLRLARLTRVGSGSSPAPSPPTPSVYT